MDLVAEKATPAQENPIVDDTRQSSLTDADRDSKNPQDEAVENYELTGAKLHILVFGLGLAVFLMALDMSILTTAIPLITEKFHSTADIGWYWSFLALFLLFEIGSAISGAATSSKMLIVGRAIAGAGAAGLLSGTLSIVAVSVTLRLRALYTGILSSMFGVALICGPLLGGAFTQHVSWRWVFYINLPLGVLTIGALVFFFNPPIRSVEKDPLKERIKRLDLLGVAVFIPAIFMILVALQWGGVKYAWKSSQIIGLLVGGGATLIVFAVYQSRKGNMAMIPPAILTERTVLLASLAAMWGAAATMIFGVWMPEWFQVIKGVSPVQSGVNMLPAMLAQIVSTVIAGGATTALGYYNPWLICGTALMSIASGLFTTFEVNTGSPRWIGYLIILGLGNGMFITSPLIAVQSVLSPADTPIGISIVTFFQMFGGSLFVALSQTIFNEQLSKELVKNAPGIDIQALLAAGTFGIREVVSPEQLPGVLQSYNAAITDTFYLSASTTAIAFFVALGLPWINVKKKSLTAGAA
ncbi:hypothetical protein N0V83_003833 [Neocucurbitaria cava]|uniref:Major facilitator superfamily (MFS) profile domain-containing protein n=1 Tax=Neocucurbitaria cava TaxID=798079 RepID=A0A9W8YAF7_9PLEO|nr:hypothetical protein N0V83_003833 [Neocucurbitaria cava]